MNASDNEKLVGLSEDDYLSQRLAPKPGEYLYLALSDLLLALKASATREPVTMLDLGCGGSPYRSLFPNANYERADIAGVPNIDYEIPTSVIDWHLPVADNRYDIILSSQVLEHVLHPQPYLREAQRLLKPGGRLILATHGMFEDHGCPYDFRRWTADGLTHELQQAGFVNVRMSKLTTGPRAALFLLQRDLRRPPRTGRESWWFRWFVRMQQRRRASFDRWCDAAFANHRFVTNDLGQHKIYIGLFLEASKIA